MTFSEAVEYVVGFIVATGNCCMCVLVYNEENVIIQKNPLNTVDLGWSWFIMRMV